MPRTMSDPPIPVNQAHLSKALYPLTSQLRTLQPKQVQSLALGVHLKGVLKAAGHEYQGSGPHHSVHPSHTTL